MHLSLSLSVYGSICLSIYLFVKRSTFSIYAPHPQVPCELCGAKVAFSEFVVHMSICQERPQDAECTWGTLGRNFGTL